MFDMFVYIAVTKDELLYSEKRNSQELHGSPPSFFFTLYFLDQQSYWNPAEKFSCQIENYHVKLRITMSNMK